ncbi:MAG: hypothetical protein WCX12_01615 [Candidatus Paceibacterota bacterium]|jgi:hypothetical protein
MTRKALTLLIIVLVVVIVQLIGFLMSDTGYFFSPRIDVVLGGIELFGLGLWLGIYLGRKGKAVSIEK